MIAALAAAAACGGEEPKRPAPEARPAPAAPAVEPAPGATVPTQSRAVVGISPVDFKCDTIAPQARIEEIVAAPLQRVTTGFTPPEGVAAACHYESTAADRPGEWSYDIDCRERALGDARRLIDKNAPEPDSVPVEVGREGLDHHNAQLLFIDDDAPCYVRIQARDQADRLAIGMMLADGLTRRNAPGQVTFVDVSIGEMVQDAPAPKGESE